MNRTTTRKGFFSLLLALAFALTACGGGGGESIEPIQWPQPMAFTDFTGGQSYYYDVGHSNLPLGSCSTCITLRGIARSSTEMSQLFPDQRTSLSWPAAYRDKLYSELPIDYSSKMAVVLVDQNSGVIYQYAMNKVEESENAVTISVLKCVAYHPYDTVFTTQFGLLIPKTTKPIQVVLVQSGKPVLPGYEILGLGGC
jgi:hypothetical protein